METSSTQESTSPKIEERISKAKILEQNPSPQDKAIKPPSKTADQVKVDKRVRKNIGWYVRKRDSLTYTFFLLALLLNAFLFSYSPTGYMLDFNFYLYAFLYGMRVVRFLKFRNGWFLIDWCYMGNWVSFGLVYYDRYNATAFCVGYYFAVSVLGLSLITFKNGYIFHSIDHITSLFIHHTGLVVMTAMRWAQDPKLDAVLNAPGGDILSNYHNCLKAYFTWFSIYYVTIFILFWQYIKQNKFLCLYSYTLQIMPITRRFIYSCRGKFKGLMFMLTHIIWSWGAGSISLLCFYYKPINFLVLYVCIAFGAYNGATYIFEYMVKHYENGIKSHEFIQQPERIISLDFGELAEAIGSGRSAFTMPPPEDQEAQSKPDPFLSRFIMHMVKM